MTEAISFTTKNKNEDSYACFSTEKLDLLIIADGIGSLKYAAQTSNFITNFIIQKFKQEQNLTKIINSINTELLEYANENNFDPNQMGSTIIIAQRTLNILNIYWLGNGALFIIKPEQLLQTPYRPLVNIIAPDTIHSSLSRYLSPQKYLQPNFISLQFEITPLVIACSDGIFSEESAEMAKDKNNILWKLYPMPINSLADKILKAIKNDDLNLKKILKEFQDEHKNQITDDATIGVMITSDFIKKIKDFKL